jgi:hypothetical protein
LQRDEPMCKRRLPSGDLSAKKIQGRGSNVLHRRWMLSLITEANVAHELHVLDVSDAICKARLRTRNESGDHPSQIDEATYDLFMSYFVPPTRDESFNVIVHKP